MGCARPPSPVKRAARARPSTGSSTKRPLRRPKTQPPGFGRAAPLPEHAASLALPEPPAGTEFIAERVNLTYTSGDTDFALDYSADCSGVDTWRYDDESAPTNIVLCDETCATVQRDPDAALSVEFGCARRDRPR